MCKLCKCWQYLDKHWNAEDLDEFITCCTPSCLSSSSNCSPSYPASLFLSIFVSRWGVLLPAAQHCSTLSFSCPVPSSCFHLSPNTRIFSLLEKALMGRRPAMTRPVVCSQKLMASVNNSGLCGDEKRASVLLKIWFHPAWWPGLGQRRINCKKQLFTANHILSQVICLNTWWKEQFKALFPPSLQVFLTFQPCYWLSSHRDDRRLLMMFLFMTLFTCHTDVLMSRKKTSIKVQHNRLTDQIMSKQTNTSMW